MADDKKIEKKERTVEDRLKDLYLLQTILSEMDRIKVLRGELPNEVKDLEDEIAMYQTRIQKYKDEVTELKRQAQKLQGEIEDRTAKINKYREQQKNVRNNREFDLLTKEVEFQTLEIELGEKHVNDYSRQIENKTAEIKATEESIQDTEHVLAEKRAELEEIVSETRQDEELEPKIDAYTLNAFKRIRKNARNGLGVVYIQRNACGGCFNRIPPQKQLEIKMHKKIIVCEYCGRILIDPEIAGVEAPESK